MLKFNHPIYPDQPQSWPRWMRGATVAILGEPPYHFGVLVWYCFQWYVVHALPGRGTILSTLGQFAHGRPIRVTALAPDPAAAERRAFAQLGAPYNLFFNNCEQVASRARTGVATSPQLAIGSLLLATLLTAPYW